MNGIAIRDVVFEQTYQKNIIKACDAAFYSGLTQGISSVVALIDHIHAKDPNAVIDGKMIREELAKMHVHAKEMVQESQVEAQRTPTKSDVESNNVISFPSKKK